ncbi:MAG: hypothetical protein QOC82_1735 [Frankiaceae bacterium]|jgi:hypothetical protein|nr:hypothetical protein [Frankiaceae bacterium]
MTAVGGDPHLVGQAAAKAAVATVLDRIGHTDQRLPGEARRARAAAISQPSGAVRRGERRRHPLAPSLAAAG